MPNRGGFSWKRAVGVTRVKQRIARETGIPLTKSGRQRKVGRMVTGGGCLVPVIVAASIGLLVAACMSTVGTPTPNPADTRGTPSTPATPAGTPAVTPFSATTVDGLEIRTVAQLLAARKAGDAPGGPYALRGYWSDRSSPHTCVIFPGTPSPLEIWCHDGEFGITEFDEPVVGVDLQRGTWTPAGGPVLTPYVAADADRALLFGVNTAARQGPIASQGTPFWLPVPIVVVGHFDDPGAASCRAVARQKCLDRFVIDRIVWFDPGSVPAPTPTPEPTPFPLSSPPPPLFEQSRCYKGVPMAFIGWSTSDLLKTELDFRGFVYAMVTRDVIPLSNWGSIPMEPNHKSRWWGQGVCYADPSDLGVIGFTVVKGTGYLELDNGSHVPIDPP